MSVLSGLMLSKGIVLTGVVHIVTFDEAVKKKSQYTIRKNRQQKNLKCSSAITIPRNWCNDAMLIVARCGHKQLCFLETLLNPIFVIFVSKL